MYTNSPSPMNVNSIFVVTFALDNITRWLIINSNEVYSLILHSTQQFIIGRFIIYIFFSSSLPELDLARGPCPKRKFGNPCPKWIFLLRLRLRTFILITQLFDLIKLNRKTYNFQKRFFRNVHDIQLGQYSDQFSVSPFCYKY